MPELCFAYYCSGHGYGHATRVSAFASHLLSLNPSPSVHIVSSAPSHVFSDSVALGASYRYAEIDPVIVQPLAYRVDRQRSLDVLQSFLDHKEAKIVEEARWLKNMDVDCVLSDAAFLAFLAANRASIPSILISNFTFDSVYSYLSAAFINQSRPHHTYLDATSGPHHVSQPDLPLSEEPLNSLVEQLYDGYLRADMLLRLPGAIPIPSFAQEPSLPSPRWIHPISKTFKSSIITHLTQNVDSLDIHPSLPFASIPFTSQEIRHKPLPRIARAAPLLVRHASPEIYTQAGRSKFLSSLGVPGDQYDSARTRILVVSFGGQIIHRPSRSGSTSHPGTGTTSPKDVHGLALSSTESSLSGQLQKSLTVLTSSKPQWRPWKMPPPLSTPSHIHIPGAPAPALKSPVTPRLPDFNTSPPTPTVSPDETPPDGMPDVGKQFLPDESWIAVVCGVSDSKEWRSGSRTISNELNEVTGDAGKAGDEDDLPERFYIAPKGVYMPDLMAVGDVLLGKLGYGTVAECVESCTPFVYVSRPLFVEEHGLRLLLDSDGVGVEMKPEEYEAGDWAVKVAEAWKKGERAKTERKSGLRVVDRQSQGRAMAQFVVDWVSEWNRQVSFAESDSGVTTAGI